MRTSASLALASLAFALTACGAPTSGADAPVATADLASATPTPTPTPTPDALAACGAFGDGGDESLMNRIPAALTGIGATITTAQTNELLAVHDGLVGAIEVAPAALAASLTSLDVPFAQFAEVMDGGGGAISMDTSHVMEDVTDVMSLCVDAGYTLPS